MHRILILGNETGLIARADLVVIYIRGFLAAVDYVELEKEYIPEPEWLGEASKRMLD